jgi:hypothetical protein
VLALYCRGKTVDLYDPNVGLLAGARKGAVQAYLADCMLRLFNGLHPGGTFKDFAAVHGSFVLLAFRPQAALH